MSRIEELKKLKEQYEELCEEIIDLEKDPVFLLSKEEYEKYQDKIPPIDCCWWLRSRHKEQRDIFACVDTDKLCSCGADFEYKRDVRPALRISSNEWFVRHLRDRIIYCGVAWTKIDEKLYIAETPIASKQFNSTQVHGYAFSDIREFLLDWYEKRREY